MGRAPYLEHALWLGLSAYCSMACSGKRIRLGEAPLDWRVDAGTVVDSSERSTGAVPSSLSSADGANATVPSSPIDTSESHADDAGTACNPAGVAPDEVVWIGDSWFTIPGTQRTRVEELARQAGTLGAGESYENRAEAASNLAAIVEQYEASKEGDPPRVLIMDGGTWDTIVAAGSPSTVARVIVDFNAFLERVATDGTVQHLIYMLMPELPQIPGVAALRPGLMEACDNSRVPCHFLDLQPLWADHPEYTSMPDGIQASAEGATVIADQIWAIMRRECIAQ